MGLALKVYNFEVCRISCGFRAENGGLMEGVLYSSPINGKFVAHIVAGKCVPIAKAAPYTGQ
jgi:hypothetical protein